MKIYKKLYDQIVSPKNLFLSWDKFRSDKANKFDVMEFYCNLELNIFKLNEELVSGTYEHGPYVSFYIHDPKQRYISKALVRDRILHHSIFTVLNPIFEATYIPTSFSCREGKGTHRGVSKLSTILRKVSGNGTKPCYGLKCDVKKFFDSVDHKILKEIISRKIKDVRVLWLVDKVIDSYISKRSNLFERKGIPIGNLTSQLFANIYLNEFDQFIKHELKIKNYVRYTDDFIIVSQEKEHLEKLAIRIKEYLSLRLKLKLHPQKIFLRKFIQGQDFLGYVVRPYHILLRTKTKKRMFIKHRLNFSKYEKGMISKTTVEQSLQSYLGILSHANAFRLGESLINEHWLLLKEKLF